MAVLRPGPAEQDYVGRTADFIDIDDVDPGHIRGDVAVVDQHAARPGCWVRT